MLLPTRTLSLEEATTIAEAALANSRLVPSPGGVFEALVDDSGCRLLFREGAACCVHQHNYGKIRTPSAALVAQRQHGD